jgi:hypothetical protein
MSIASNGSSPNGAKSNVQQLDERGFVLIRNLLSATEVETFRSQLLQSAGVQEGKIDPNVRWCLPDGPNKHSEWWPLITHPRLVQVMHELIGPDVRYLRTADLQVNNNRSVWHRDNTCRQFGIGPDFDESRVKHQVYRVGVYLNSYAESRSSLGLIPGSHRRESAFTRFELHWWERARVVMRKPYLLPHLLSVRPVWLKFEAGDVLIFDSRVLHTPSHIRGPRLAVYLSYGANNQHSRNFWKYYVRDRTNLGYEELKPDLKQLLIQRGMLMEDDYPAV